MKFAAYTEETIWAVEETEAAARSEGEASMRDNDASAKLAEMKVAPIDDDLVEALAKAEAGGGEVLFDLIDGELCDGRDGRKLTFTAGATHPYAASDSL
jgi:hypothetical protein